MGIIWTIIIGFVAGVVAKFIMPGPNEPSGFIMTTILGVVGAVVASYLGRALGWYEPGQGAGFIRGDVAKDGQDGVAAYHRFGMIVPQGLPGQCLDRGARTLGAKAIGMSRE